MGPLIPSIIFIIFGINNCICSSAGSSSSSSSTLEKWSTPISDRRNDFTIDDWVPLAGAESSLSLPRAIDHPQHQQQQQYHQQQQQQQQQPQSIQPLVNSNSQQIHLIPQFHPPPQHSIRQPYTAFASNSGFNFQPQPPPPQLVALSATPQFLMPTNFNGSKPDVQLVYVPVDSLRQGRIPHNLDQQFVRQGKLQQQFLQFQNNIQQIQQQQQQVPLRTTTLPYSIQHLPSSSTTTTTTTTSTTQPTLKVKPTLKPHQPPLSVYMGGGQQIRLSDVVHVLMNAKSIAVLDHIGPNTPQVFVGPSNIQPPDGYAKFELPYLNSLESNRIERKVEQLPFFVAPLSFQPPPGYSKIPFPAPHVGSVVVSNATTSFVNNKQEIISTHSPIPPSPPTPLPTISPIRTRKPPQQPKLPTITAELPGLVNSLQDSKNNNNNYISSTPLPTQQRFNTQRQHQQYEITTAIPRHHPSTLEPELSIIPNSQSIYPSTTPAHEAEVALQQPEQQQHQLTFQQQHQQQPQQQYLQEVSVQPPPPSYQLDQISSIEDDEYLPPTTTMSTTTTPARPFRGRQRGNPARNSRTRQRPTTKSYDEQQEYTDSEQTTPSTTTAYRSHVRSRPRTTPTLEATPLQSDGQRTRQRTPGRKRITSSSLTTSTEHYNENENYPKLPENENYPKIPKGENYPQPIQRTTIATQKQVYSEQEQQSQHQVEVNKPITSYQSEQPNIYNINSFNVDGVSEIPPSTENTVIQEMQYFTPQRNKIREPDPEKIFQIEEEEELQTTPTSTTTTTTTTTSRAPHRRTRVRTRQRINNQHYDNNNEQQYHRRASTQPTTTTTTTSTTTEPQQIVDKEEESYGFFRLPNFKSPSTGQEQPYEIPIEVEDEEITIYSTTIPTTTSTRQTTHRRYNNNFINRGTQQSHRRNPQRTSPTTTEPPTNDQIYTVRPSRRQQLQHPQSQTRLPASRGRIRKPTTTTTTTTEVPTRRPQYNNEVDNEVPTRRISTKFTDNIDPTTEKFQITLVDEQPVYQQVVSNTKQQQQQQSYIPQDEHYTNVDDISIYEQPIAIQKTTQVNQEYVPERVYQSEHKSLKSRVRQENPSNHHAVYQERPILQPTIYQQPQQPQQNQQIYDDYLFAQPSPSSVPYEDVRFEDGGQESKLSTVKIAPPTSYQNMIMSSTTEGMQDIIKETTIHHTNTNINNPNSQEEMITTPKTITTISAKPIDELTTTTTTITPPFTEESNKELLTNMKKASDPETEKKSRPVRRRLIRVRVKNNNNNRSDMLDTAESQNIGIINRIPLATEEDIKKTQSKDGLFSSTITTSTTMDNNHNQQQYDNNNPEEQDELNEEELDRVVTQRYLVKMINEELAEAITDPDPWQKQLMDQVQKELMVEQQTTTFNNNQTTSSNEEINDPLTISTTTPPPSSDIVFTTTISSSDETNEDGPVSDVTITTTEKWNSEEITTNDPSEITTTASTSSYSSPATPPPTTTTTTTTTTRRPKGPPMPDMPEILGTSTTTEISHETEICFRGRCVKTKGKLNDEKTGDLEASE